MAFGNFHIHTFFSDGLLSPSELIRQINETSGLEFFAITDHDTLSAIEPIFRHQRQYALEYPLLKKRFIVGIELSLKEKYSGLTVHLIGLFPDITDDNYKEKLKRLDSILGKFCVSRCRQRGISDMDARIKHAFDLNLDGLQNKFGSAEEIIVILKNRAKKLNYLRLVKEGKENDIIQHPIPVTYQIIIDHWENLVPNSSRRKISLYALLPDRDRIKELAGIYISEGMTETEAHPLAVKNQGILATFQKPPIMEMDMMDGLELLQQAKAVTILAHPAVNHYSVSLESFDNHVTLPLIKRGLNGIEVFYPYDGTYREKAIKHYGRMGCEHGLLISGGTDFHGDGRIGLTDVKLDLDEVLRIINEKKV